MINRRQAILGGGAAALGLFLSNWSNALAADQPRRKVLFFSKSSGFEHAVIKRKDGQPSFVETILADLRSKSAIDFTFSKDGSLFSKDYLARFDAYMFYTTGDLLSPGKDGNPPMTADGKNALLDAIANGKGFLGVHSATDTFHTGETAETNTNQPRTWRYRDLGDKADPYTRMIGAEFIIHSVQQSAKLRIVDSKFPGMPEHAENIEINDEWYSMTDFSKDLHVLLVQETAGMTGIPYQRPPYPSTWARVHGKGRVFYTAMGHREDVWTNPIFQGLLVGGLAWVCGSVEVDIAPNIEKVTPDCWELPPLSAPVASDPAKYKPEQEKTIGTRPAGLRDPSKKEIAMRLVSAAENSSLDWKSQYSYIEYNVEHNDKENRGYTAGIIGFTSRTHDMLELLEYYAKIAPTNALIAYLPALRKADGTPSAAGLGKRFMHAWKSAADDPKFRKAQDHERDRVYFDPAVTQAEKDGLRALGQFVYYDAIVMHGPGDDPASFGGIRSQALKNIKAPSQSGDEAIYLSAFLDARKAAMLTEQGHGDTTRIDDMQRVFLRAGNLDLNPPLRFKVYGDSYEIPRAAL